MRALFLGLGKVNRSIAHLIHGERIGFVETNGGVEVYRFDHDWNLDEKIPGNFDSLNWENYLPAQVFISPGIDPRRPFMKKVQASEVRELDFFAKKFKGKIIAITGTDGKSTFCMHLGEVLKRALPEKKIFIGGNIGTAMCEGLREDFDIAVLEISSFQAERIKNFEPDLAVILNLDRDHLDRYESVQEYHHSKWNLLDKAVEVVYPDDEVGPTAISASQISFKSDESLLEILKKLVRYLSKTMKFEHSDQVFENLPLLPHRLQRLKDDHGRVFINDSKATTVHAINYAITNLRKEFPNLNIILGGRSKGDDFSRLKSILRDRDKIYIYGEAKNEVAEQLSEFSSQIKKYDSLKALLEEEVPRVKSGECLLLSPGCSSFDEFQNFEERGNFFLSFVK